MFAPINSLSPSLSDGCLKVSLCVYLVLGFFGAFWPIFTVDVAVFTHDNLATSFSNKSFDYMAV